MLLIVGLGNPGQKFEKTRHNLGFWIVDEFYENKKTYNFSDFKAQEKLNSLICKGNFNDSERPQPFCKKGRACEADKKIILAKPQTFMNLSGKSVKLLIAHYLPKTKSYCNKKAMAMLLQYLWVVHDDVDLPLGKIRISKGRSSAGHKGVQSIIDELKTKDFVRFRIGIHPQAGKPKNPEKFVLQKFNKDEEKIVKEVIKKTVEAIEFTASKGTEKAMSKYNK